MTWLVFFFPMLMQHSLGLFLFHSREVRLPRKGGQGVDLIGCALGKNFLKVRSFLCCSFLLSIDSCLVEHIVSNHSGNKASSLSVNGHMDSFPSLVSDHLSLGLLSFYTRLYWLTVTRGARVNTKLPQRKREVGLVFWLDLLYFMAWFGGLWRGLTIYESAIVRWSIDYCMYHACNSRKLWWNYDLDLVNPE